MPSATGRPARAGPQPPFGASGPSREDTAITERLVRVGRLVGIEVVDHVIGAGGLFL